MRPQLWLLADDRHGSVHAHQPNVAGVVSIDSTIRRTTSRMSATGDVGGKCSDDRIELHRVGSGDLAQQEGHDLRGYRSRWAGNFDDRVEAGCADSGHVEDAHLVGGGQHQQLVRGVAVEGGKEFRQRVCAIGGLPVTHHHVAIFDHHQHDPENPA
jgi:hypothetical protein